ncbi:hypothetical protein SUGI_0175770 [Cryptomeria japonica]|nr:hypothetical protein SUGI_0175770 [Cryptomeria japonica]
MVSPAHASVTRPLNAAAPSGCGTSAHRPLNVVSPSGCSGGPIVASADAVSTRPCASEPTDATLVSCAGGSPSVGGAAVPSPSVFPPLPSRVGSVVLPMRRLQQGLPRAMLLG